MDKGTKDKVARSPGENGGKQNAQDDLQSRTGGDEAKGKTQEKMERRDRKGSSSARSEEMEKVGDRQEKMAGYCSIGQSSQRAVVLREEEEEEIIRISISQILGSSDFDRVTCCYTVQSYTQ